ncbi:MBL fold metallo-hydrolase [Rhodococcus erythropolis]|nr:MBL fold metallo-hydrolase [Rhodococcus erythropolis]
MHITHYGHACVFVETSTTGHPTRVLIDPGTYSTGFEDLRDLDLVLITHSHPDHIDVERLTTLLEENPSAELVVDPGTATMLADSALTLRAARPGDSLDFDNVKVDVVGGEHACIHASLPNLANNGYILDGSLLHPGDAFDNIPAPVDVLLLPAGGPWMKIGESIDFLRATAPRVVIPIHQAGLAEVHQQLHYQLLRNLAPAHTEVMILEEGIPYLV